MITEERQMKKNTNEDNKKYKGFDENMFPETDDKVNVGNVRPFTKYRAAEMALCLAAVVMGLLYLYADAISLSVLLPSFSAGLFVITVLRAMDAKATGAKGFVGTVPVVFSALLTVLVIVVTIIYFRDMSAVTSAAVTSAAVTSVTATVNVTSVI